MQFFNLPQFCINKMKEFMIEKKQKELQRIAEMEADIMIAYIMIADQVLELLEETEYKDSPHAIPEKMQFFNLPQFCINKMKEFMIEKKQKWDIPRNYIYNDGGFLSTNE